MDEVPSKGKRIEDRYELTEPLGEGAYGEIWVATDAKFQGRRVAVKFLKAPFDRDDDAARRFDKEANALGILQHPNVVAVIDRGRWHDRPYIVMEFIDGTPLDEWLQQHRDDGTLPDLARVRDIFDQVCRGVAAAHAVRSPGAIVHRDLKPANVMIIEGARGDSIVKVLDFGIAQLGARDGTLPGVRFGTPDYMAPEQASGQAAKVSPATDVFALGVILYEMLTLKWYAGDEEQWHYASTIRNSRVEPLMTGARAGVPSAVWRVIAQAMNADVKGRYEDAGALRQALQVAWKKAAAPRPMALALVGLAVVACGLGVAFWKNSTSHPRVVTTARTPPRPLARDAGRAAPGDASTRATAPVVEAPRCPDGMLKVEAGSFLMGSAEMQGEADERPAHRVTLRAFCIDRTEATVAQYAACATAGRCPPAPTEVNWANITPRDRTAYSAFCNAGHADRAEHPINCVGFAEADAFCRSRDARLPTEAEWEFAARGPSARVYPWGDDAPGPTRLNACGSECARLGATLHEQWQTMFDGDDGWPSTAPVGSFAAGASGVGAMDMAGNVAEWTSDRYGAYAATAQTDPTGPATGERRVARGGGWNFGDGLWVRSAARDAVAPEFRDRYLGMRCARDLVR